MCYVQPFGKFNQFNSKDTRLTLKCKQFITKPTIDCNYDCHIVNVVLIKALHLWRCNQEDRLQCSIMEPLLLWIIPNSVADSVSL